MAKVKFGGGVTKIMGKLAGNIFSQNKGGNYVKAYNIPTNPQTIKQLAVRAAFGTISVLWSALTAAQRLSWTEWAALIPFINSVGDEYFLSGKGLFQKINTVSHELEENVFSDTPENFNNPAALDPVTIVATESTQGIVLTSDEPTVPADTIFVIDGAPLSNAGVINNNSRFKRSEFLDETTAWTAHDAGTAYVALFGAFVEGQRVELRFFAYNKLNGTISAYTKASTIAVAGV